MNSSIWFGSLRLEWFIVHFKGSQVIIYLLRCTLVDEDCFCIRSSADPDEIPHSTAFHVGLHSLPECLFRGFQHLMGYMTSCLNLLTNLSSDKK